jgi:hypothetical protein
MAGGERKPWDERLIDWMSRDSYRTDTRESSARGRAGVTAIWVLYATVSAILRPASWVWYAYSALVAVIGLSWWLWERKRHDRTE